MAGSSNDLSSLLEPRVRSESAHNVPTDPEKTVPGIFAIKSKQINALT